MKFHVVVEINGEQKVYIADADNEIDAQHHVFQDINKSIIMKSCSPWVAGEEENNEVSS